jgi:hypothetical protein
MYFPVKIYPNFPVPKLVAPAGAGAWDIPNMYTTLLIYYLIAHKKQSRNPISVTENSTALCKKGNKSCLNKETTPIKNIMQ